MGPENIIDAETLSALGWWQLAGVDIAVEDRPRDWFAKPSRSVPAIAATAPVEQPRTAAPDDLEAVHRALAALAVPGAGAERLLPEGDVASGLMLLVDMPEAEDAHEGRLLTGATGRLLDNMLGALGRDRASIYLATLLPARPAGGQLDAASIGPAVRLAAQHVALAAPRALLLCGDGASRALLGMPMLAARGRIHEINQGGAIVPTIATFHPCRLLDHPMQKAGAWQDLRLLLGVLAG